MVLFNLLLYFAPNSYMKYYTADIIYPISTSPVRNGIIVLQDDDTIINVFRDKDEVARHLDITLENSQVQKSDGIICPGFVNAHCHLELSHLKNQVESGTGLTGFIKGILSKREAFTQEQITDSLEKAGEEMKANGIVAVGDISNSNVSFAYKNISDIYFHTFIELFDLVPERALAALEEGKNLAEELHAKNIRNNEYSIVPHAPYSVSEKLFQLISSLNDNQPVSIHNQETFSENELFKNRSGKLFDFFNSLGNSLTHISKTGKTSLQSYVAWMNRNAKTLFVHNTFTTEGDIYLAKSFFNEAWWCLCPKANLFIENILPDVELLHNSTTNIVFGTDSYASNTTLSILEEMKTLRKYFTHLNLDEMLKWATLNGAVFLGIEKKYGSFGPGKKPGINLITNTDVTGNLTDKSKVKKLV